MPKISSALPLMLTILPGLLVATSSLAGPFSDPGHEPATMAAWASEVDDFEVGPRDIDMPELGPASFGVPEATLGPPSVDGLDVYSLGDGGFVTLYFASGIGNGADDDFAVYENGFYSPGGLFAELAFVEVSSNGIDFARFPSTSLQTEIVEDFSPIDPSDFDNLAGDQPVGLGTGFDLKELMDHPLVSAALLDLTDVRFVRLIDVIGDGTTFDAQEHAVYDPYPTPFDSGGFDAEAIGVIHTAPEPGIFVMFPAGLAALLALARARCPSRRCMPRA
jgi:hypothetical protein